MWFYSNYPSLVYFLVNPSMLYPWPLVHLVIVPFTFLTTLGHSYQLCFGILISLLISHFYFSLGFPTLNPLSNVVSGLWVALGVLPSVIPPKLIQWGCYCFGIYFKLLVLFWLQASKSVSGTLLVSDSKFHYIYPPLAYYLKVVQSLFHL